MYLGTHSSIAVTKVQTNQLVNSESGILNGDERKESVGS